MAKKNKLDRARRYADGAKHAVSVARAAMLKAQGELVSLDERIQEVEGKLKEPDEELAELEKKVEERSALLKGLRADIDGIKALLKTKQEGVTKLQDEVRTVEKTTSITAEKLGVDLSKVTAEEADMDEVTKATEAVVAVAETVAAEAKADLCPKCGNTGRVGDDIACDCLYGKSLAQETPKEST